MDIEEEKRMVVEHICLTKIAEKYKGYIKLIEREKENFVVEGIKFSPIGPMEDMEIDPHITIPYEFILEGLRDALAKVQRGIDFIEDVFHSIESNQ